MWQNFPSKDYRLISQPLDHDRRKGDGRKDVIQAAILARGESRTNFYPTEHDLYAVLRLTKH